MVAVMQRVVFVAAGREYSWADVVAYAKVRGAWTELHNPRLEPATADRSALDRWRRERRLLSADETIAWLKQWDLELADVERHLGIRHGGAVPSPEPDRAAWARAVCSGAHGILAAELAARVALAPDPPRADSALDRPLLEALERAYEQSIQEVEARDVARLVNEHADDWVRVRLSSVSLPDIDAAREAILSLRLDGTTMQELAAMTGAEIVEASAFVDELDTEMRPHVMGGVAGDAFGPFSDDSGHRVVQIVAKGVDVDDVDVRARARSLALDLAIARSQARLVWHERL